MHSVLCHCAVAALFYKRGFGFWREEGRSVMLTGKTNNHFQSFADDRIQSTVT